MIFLSKLLSPECVLMLDATDKDAALAQLVQAVSGSDHVRDAKRLLDAIRGRELVMSTGIGFGIAIPHAKIPSVADISLAVGVSKAGIEFGSLDDKPVHIIVLIAASEQQQDKYIHTLARIMMVLKNPEVRQKLTSAKTPADVLKVFAAY